MITLALVFTRENTRRNSPGLVRTLDRRGARAPERTQSSLCLSPRSIPIVIVVDFFMADLLLLDGFRFRDEPPAYLGSAFSSHLSSHYGGDRTPSATVR